MGDATKTAERFYRLFGEGHLLGAYEAFADDCISIKPSGRLTNEAHLSAADTLKSAVPDGHMELLRTLEVGDQVYITGRFKGTHTGDFSNAQGTIHASGSTVDLFFADYMPVVDGKIVECEAVLHSLGGRIRQGHRPPARVARQPAVRRRCARRLARPSAVTPLS
jgi:predicted ester cyclase